MKMDKKHVAHILEEIGTLLDLRGENSFKCRAYHNAARTIESLGEDLEQLVRSGELTNVKGIGKGIGDKITELVTTGRMEYHEELKRSLPPGLPDMLRIQGLGPKKVKVLFDQLGIESIAQLKQAAEEHRLQNLDGFGARTEENILVGIDSLERHADRFLYPVASEAARRIVESLKRLPGVTACEITGSLRRKKETIGDIDILVSASEKQRKPIMQAFSSHEEVVRVIAQGETKSSVTLRIGINCDVRIVSKAEFPFALNYFTGSKEHNVEMRSRALAKGWSLNEYGFSPAKGGKGKRRIPECTTENDLYRALGLEFVPPELREEMGEFEAAEQGMLPELVELKRSRGTFHCHTNFSDGANSLAEMVAAAQALGWSYLGIADHSHSAAYAGGLSPARVRAQFKEIESVQKRLKGFRIYRGSEVDILSDGSLDFNDKILASFDYVVASIHSKFKMNEAEATKRIIKALKNKFVTMLGHPTGRLLLSRDPYPVNMTEVLQAAADYGRAIEINAHPMRLDLDWRLVRQAKAKKIPIFINPDAHNTEGLRDVEYGVNVARKGWLSAKDVANTWSQRQIDRFFQK